MINLKDWKKLLIPEFPISAIVIEEKAVKVFRFDKAINRFSKAAKYPLPSGIIEEGVLKNPQALKYFFAALKNKLWKSEKSVWAILSLPSANFFTNIFNIPDLEEERLEEAILFNIQISSPLPLKESYFDWEDWGGSETDGEKEIFAVLGIKKQIDPFLEILESLRFKIIAVEPSALGEVRFLSKFTSKNQPFLIFDLRKEGIEFIIAEGEKLIFFDFDSWSEIFGANAPKNITVDLIKKHIASELPMLLNFYLLKRKKSIKDFVFLSDNNQLVETFSRWIEEQYFLLPIKINLPPYFGKVTRDWFGVMGAALRGLIPRSKDTIVSLAPVGTEENYYKDYLLRIISLWGKATITVAISLVSLLAIINFAFFKKINDSYAKDLSSSFSYQAQQKEAVLAGEAQEFNDLLDKLIQAQKNKKEIGRITTAIFSLADSAGVKVKRIIITNQEQASQNSITVSGEAFKKNTVLDFKDSLEQSNLFQEISLPLSNLVESPAGFSFSLNVKIK